VYLGIFFLVLFGLLFLSLPIGLVFASVTILPKLVNPSFSFTIEASVRSMTSALDSYPILAVPLFMLSGVVMARGISEKIFNFFAYFIGNKTAGFPCTVVLTCLFYGAISGSGPATTAAVGSMAIPFLISMGYDTEFSSALVAISGGLGVIIPPSIPFIVLATTTNTSTSDLFIAGILPGCLIGFFLMLYAFMYCRKHGEDKEKLESNYRKIREHGFWLVFKESFWALLTPVIILGSIYGGIASPTEAAAMSIYYALFVSIFIYRSIKLKELFRIFCEGVKTYSAVLFIIAAAVAFSRVISLLQVSQAIKVFLVATESKFLVLLIINTVLLLAGMIMDPLPTIMILAPIMLPVVQQFGMDPAHFGIMMVVNLAIGFVTPPLGMNLFVTSNLTGIPVMVLSRKVLPMIVFFALAGLLIIFFPQISLVLLGRGV
jgi:C4-dicarboxylate transporter DctM subunit